MKHATYEFVSSEYRSNCIAEAIKAKLRNRNTKVYFCRPRFVKGLGFQTFHFMWSDETGDYDFTDKCDGTLPWFQHIWFRGAIRRFPRGFAERYSKQRNRWK